MKEWWVRTQKYEHVRKWWGPYADKETAELYAEGLHGEIVTIDEYARKMIENSRNIIYRNQEGRTERERKQRMQRTWFLSVRLRWM